MYVHLGAISVFAVRSFNVTVTPVSQRSTVQDFFIYGNKTPPVSVCCSSRTTHISIADKMSSTKIETPILVEKALLSHFLYVVLAGSLQNCCRSLKTEEAQGGTGLFHLAARRVLLWSPRCSWYNPVYKCLKSETIWLRSFSHRCPPSSVFVAHRSPEVLPQGTSWTPNDIWLVWWVATGLQVRRHKHMTLWIPCETHTLGANDH